MIRDGEINFDTCYSLLLVNIEIQYANLINLIPFLVLEKVGEREGGREI